MNTMIKRSSSTIPNSYDIILEGEDYTLGKILEYMLYEKFYEGTQIFTYCGFKKVHPHDNDSIIRIAYKDAVEKSTIKTNINECIIDLTDIYIKIINIFKKK